MLPQHCPYQANASAFWALTGGIIGVILLNVMKGTLTQYNANYNAI